MADSSKGAMPKVKSIVVVPKSSRPATRNAAKTAASTIAAANKASSSSSAKSSQFGSVGDINSDRMQMASDVNAPKQNAPAQPSNATTSNMEVEDAGDVIEIDTGNEEAELEAMTRESEQFDVGFGII